jgi:microcompartment protein CcmL/EutN
MDNSIGNDAIGMVETRGMVPLVHATDAMLKTANVTYRGWRKVGSGFCTVVVSGDVGAVRAAVDAGAAAARSVGELRSVHIIPRPHHDLKAVLPK